MTVTSDLLPAPCLGRGLYYPPKFNFEIWNGKEGESRRKPMNCPLIHKPFHIQDIVTSGKRALENQMENEEKLKKQSYNYKIIKCFKCRVVDYEVFNNSLTKKKKLEEEKGSLK